MATAVKEVHADSTMSLVLGSQRELELLVEKIRKDIPRYKGIPGHWTPVLIGILGNNSEQGMMQKLMAVQSTLRSLPDITYSSRLQRIAGYLGDEFNLLSDINRLITSELVFARENNAASAILDEIGRMCDLISARIKGIRAEVANVAVL